MYHISAIVKLDIQMITVSMLVWAVYIAIVISTLATYYNKAILGKAIRAIIEKGVYSKEAALTASELGFAKKFYVIRSIEKGVLSRFIRTVEDDKGEKRYYMEEELRIRAELRYSNKGTDLYAVIVGLVIFLVLAFLAAEYLTEILGYAADLIS